MCLDLQMNFRQTAEEVEIEYKNMTSSVFLYPLFLGGREDIQ